MATAFNVSVAPTGGDYSTLAGAVNACACDLTSASTKVFGHGAITGTITDGASVTGVTSGATGTCLHDTGNQILIKSITGTFQSGEVVYQTLGVNFITISDAGNSPFLNINISGTWSSPDTTNVNFGTTASYVTSASNYINIFTSGSAVTPGVYSTSAYRLELSGTGTTTAPMGIENTAINLNLSGMQFQNTGTSNVAGATAITSNNASTITLINCILKAPRYGMTSSANGGTYVMQNCICIPHSASVGNGGIAASGGTWTVYNCNFISPIYGINNAAGTVTAINCYASGASNAYQGTITKTTCASADTTGSIGLQNIAYSTANFTNVTSGSENFALVPGSALIGVGTNESGTFTTDITGATRATWDVGAFYYASSGPVITKGIMNLKTGWWGDL